MASINRLTENAIRKATAPQKLNDGGGLWLRVYSKDKKYWVFRYYARRQALSLKAPLGRPFKYNATREMGLGAYPSVSLEAARKEAAKRREQFKAHIDPINARERERTESRQASATAVTFSAFADEYVDTHEPEWSNIKHASQWRNTLASYAYPVIGQLPIASINTVLVLKVLLRKEKGGDKSFWLAKPETASRLRGRIEAILDAAIFQKLHPGPNPARWKGQLSTSLPKRSKVLTRQHHAALPFQEVGSFLEKLRPQEGIAARALEFTILTASRTGAVIKATWGEFDPTNRIWTARETKYKKVLRVPLSDRAMQILEELRGHGDPQKGDYVFPSSRQGKPLSNMAMLQLLKRMGRDDITTHGFRATFRSWAAVRTSYPSEVCEAALGHTVGTETERAYQRDDLFEKRIQLMSDWTHFCGVIQPEGDAKIIPMKKQASQ